MTENEFKGLIYILIIILAVYLYKKKMDKDERDRSFREKINKKKQENEHIENSKIIIEEKNSKIDFISEKISDLQTLTVNDTIEYKKLITTNEKNIIKEGGDSKFFEFLKLNTYLQDFKNKIIEDINYFEKTFDPDNLKKIVIDENTKILNPKEKIDKLHQNWEHVIQNIDNGLNTPFDINGKIDKLHKLSTKIKPGIEFEIKTFEFYNSLAISMAIFYLDGNKISYFEIYEAFDKLGVFDSSWQKNTLKQLESIDNRLLNLNNQLTELNSNFREISNNTESLLENINNSLKNINSGIDANVVISGIQTYQLYKINKQTKK